MTFKMSGITMNVHFETFDDKSFSQLVSLADRGPIAISISPWQIPKIPRKQINRIKEIFADDNYVLGQQGLNHKCPHCEDFHVSMTGKEVRRSGVDPWHENYCLWFGEIPEKDQMKFMSEGKKILEKTFGVDVRLYVPPNHLLGTNTLKVASELGYSWIANRALIPVAPYTQKGILVVNEGEPQIKSSSYYIHADRWRGDLEEVLKSPFISYMELKPSKADATTIAKNTDLKMIGKIRRDLQKGYGLSEQQSIDLADLTYRTRFSEGGFL